MEKELYKKIRYINRYKIRWILLWVLLISDCFAIATTPETESYVTAFIVMGFLLCILFPLEYYQKYNNIIADRYYKDSDITGSLFEKIKLTDILKCHSFSPKRYVKAMALRLLPFQIIAVMLVVFIDVFLGAAKWVDMSDSKKFIELLIAAAVLVIPMVIGYIYSHYMERELTAESAGTGRKLLNMAVSIIVMIVEYAGYILCTLWFCLLVVFGLLDDHVIWGTVKDRSVKYITYNESIDFLVIFVLFMIFLYLMWDQGSSFASMRLVGKLRIIVEIILAAVLIYHPIHAARNHVELGENEISRVSSGKIETYAIDDITDYRIYSDDGSWRMDVVYSDGMGMKLFGDTISGGEGQDEQYESIMDFAYIKYLVTYLAEHGVTGKLDDVKELRGLAEEAASDHPEMLDDFEEMERLLEIR